MIKCRDICKYFSKRKVLNKVSLNFPKYGVIAILGPSGCGKSTLLNIFSGLETYEGTLNINGYNLKSMSEEEKGDFRLRNFGFIFQDFKLFENETIYENILLPLETINNGTSKRKRDKVLDLIELVGLKGKENQLVKNLSGGEKQRVAIARSLVNEPKIIFADEPTASLDENNSLLIMEILKKISTKTLVVVVSHNEWLMHKFANKLIYMQDGEIINEVNVQTEDTNIFLAVCKNDTKWKKQTISSKFVFKHAIISLKQKKWRTLFTNTVTSLGLIGVGLSISLSSIISNNIKNSYQSIIKEDTVAVSIKNEHESIYDIEAGDFIKANQLVKQYPDLALDVGVYYEADLEKLFPDINYFNLYSENYKHIVTEFNLRSINEFKWLDFYQPNVLPKPYYHLKNNEIIIGIPFSLMSDLCFSLRIERTIESLSKYIETNPIKMSIEIANDIWHMHEEYSLNVVGFLLDNHPCIYHSNHRWNEYILETVFHLPTKEKLDQLDKYIWSIFKTPYIHTFVDQYQFLKASRSNPILDEYYLEVATDKHYLTLLKNTAPINSYRLLFLRNQIKHIPPRLKDYFKQYSSPDSHCLMTSNKGYLFYPSQFISGFSNMTYFSFDIAALENTVDILSSVYININEEQILPVNVASGYYANKNKNNVIFREIPVDTQSKFENLSLNEIVISSKMAIDLLGSVNVEGALLNVAVAKKEVLDSSGYINRDFVNTQLKVVGIIESSEYCLYHDVDWTIGFFQSMIGFSMVDLLPKTISFSVNNNIENTLESLKQSFPDYEVVHPFSHINKSVESVCDSITFVMLILAIFASIISTLLLTLCSNLHYLENRKDIGLSRCLGINKKECKKFIYYFNFLHTFVSLSLSFFELVFLSVLLSFALCQSLGGEVVITLNSFSFFAMSLIAIGICFISSFIASRKIDKAKALDLLKVKSN